MFEIISVGGGDELVRVLNAVVMTAGQSSFSTLAKLAFIFGLISSLAFIAMQSQAWTNFIKYFIGAFLFFNVVVVPKTTVYVTDVANPAVTGVKVDNVPYGLAYLISTAMSVDYTYGRSVDLAFSLPTDLRYSESGVLLGNTIIKQASQVVVGNVRTAKNMRSFLQNCVIFDLQIGKFTYEDLFKAPDLWGFITSKENSVKSRMYDHNGTMETCAAGTVKLSTELNGEVDSALQQLSNVVFPGRTSTAAKQQLVNVIPVAYETLVGISVQAEDVVKQGMVANLMLDAAQEYTASTDADAASRAFAEARMQLTTRQTLMMSSMQASTWIGYQKTVWLLILTGAFIITAPLAMLPGGIKKFIVTYVAGFFWLSSWGMMYAILNSIMYSKGAAEFQTAGASISMMSMIGHKVVSENLAMTAASMIDKVPWMAAAFTGLMGGLGMGVSNLVSQQMQIAGAVAKDMADGNISLGNTNAGNHSWNNQNANKLDLSRRMVGPGNMLEVSSNGVEVSTHADGSKSLKAPETTGAVNVQATEQIGAALTSEASRYKEQGTSLVNEGVRTQSKVTSNVMETMWSKYNDSSDANSTRDSQTQSASKAASKVKSIVEKATEGMNISERDRAELIGMVSVGMKTPGWSPVSLAANLQVQGSHARDISRMRDVATELAKNKEFRSSLEEVISFAKERNLTLSSGSHNSQTGSTREAYETSDQQIQRGSEQISQGERLSQAAERFKRADTSVQANLNDAFVNWLKDTGKSDQQVTELFSPKRVAELQMYAATFADQYAQQQVNSLLGKQHPGLPASPSGLSTASYPPPAPGNIGEQPQPRATATATAQYSSEQHAPPQTFERAQLLPANGQALATDTTQFRSDQPAAPQAPVVPASGQPQPLATDTAQFRTDNVSAPQTFERVQVLPAYGQPQPLVNDTAQIRSEQPVTPQAPVMPASGQPQPLTADTAQFRSEQPAAPQTPVMPASGQPQPLATDTAQFRSEQPVTPQAPVMPASGQPQPLATHTAQFRSEQPVTAQAPVMPASGQPQPLATDTAQLRSDYVSAPQTFERAQVLPANGQPQPLATDTVQLRSDYVSAPQTFERAQVLPANGQPQPLATDTVQLRSDYVSAPQTFERAQVLPASGQPQPLATHTAQFRSEQPVTAQAPVMPASGQPQPLATDTAQLRSDYVSAPQTFERAQVLPANGQPQPLATDTVQLRSDYVSAPQTFERAQLLPANGQALATDTTQFRSDQPAAPQAPVVPASGQPQPLATDTAQFRTDNVSAPQTFERVQVLPAYGQPQPLVNDTAQIRSEQPTAPQASVVPANGQPQPLATDTPQFRSEQPAAPQASVVPANGQPQPLATDTAQFRSEQPVTPQAPVVPASGQPQPLATDTAQFRSEQLAAPQSAIKQSLQNDGERAYLEKGNAMQSDWETKLSSFSDTPMIGDRNKTQGDRDVARSIFKTSPDNATEGDIDQKLKEARDPEKFNLLKSDLDHNAEVKVYVPTKPKPPRQYDYLLGSVPKQEPGTPALTREEVIQQAATERTASVAAHQAQAHPTVSPISVADQFNQPVHMGSTPSPVQQQDVRGMVEQAVAAQQRGSGSASSGFDIFGGDSKHSTDAKPAVEISHDSLVKEGAPLPKR